MNALPTLTRQRSQHDPAINIKYWYIYIYIYIYNYIYVCIGISSSIVLICGHVHTINYELEKDAPVVMLGGS